jgi:hypothetical protein
MSTDVVIAERGPLAPSAVEFETTRQIAEVLVKSGFFKDVRDVAQGIAKILAGRELGFQPIASLTGIFVQDGRISHAANLIAAAIKRSGKYNYRVVVLNEKICELEFYEAGKAVGRSSFSYVDAEKAGLPTGKNSHSYKHYPRNMLFARALSNGARWYTPDVFNGIAPYTPEELGAVVEGESGEVVAGADAPIDQPEEIQAPAPDSGKITHEQRKKLFGVLKSATTSHGDFKHWLAFYLQVTSTSDILQQDYEQCLDAIRRGEVAEWAANEQGDA